MTHTPASPVDRAIVRRRRDGTAPMRTDAAPERIDAALGRVDAATRRAQNDRSTTAFERST